MSFETDQTERDILLTIEHLNKLLLQNPDAADKVIARNMAGNMPKTVTILEQRRNAQPYYCEDLALALVPSLAKLEEDRNCVLTFNRVQYPGRSVRTIYLMIYQAWQWLRYNHPEKERFTQLYNQFKIAERPKQQCVRIMPRTRLQVTQFNPSVTKHVEETGPKEFDFTRLQDEIDAFITKEMTQDIEVFEPAYKVILGPTDIDAILDSVAGLEGITAKVESRCVKIMRQKV